MAIAITEGPPPTPRPDLVEEAVLVGLDSLDEPTTEEGGHWKITDEGSADWALRKLERARQQAASVQDQAARQLEAIEASIAGFVEPIVAWRDTELERLRRESLNWEGLLLGYHRSVLAENDEALSIKLPHGTLKSRKAPDTWEFDEAAFLAWAKSNAPELIRAKDPEVDKSLAKKTLKLSDNGEVTMPGVKGHVPGVSVITGTRNFDVVTGEVSS